jgi:hypothetical protein
MTDPAAWRVNPRRIVTGRNCWDVLPSGRAMRGVSVIVLGDWIPRCRLQARRDGRQSVPITVDPVTERQSPFVPPRRDRLQFDE